MDPYMFIDGPGQDEEPDGCIPFRNGIYDDDGTYIDPMSIRKPGLCVLCFHDDEEDEIEYSLCLLNRYGQRNEDDFECGNFMRKSI